METELSLSGLMRDSRRLGASNSKAVFKRLSSPSTSDVVLRRAELLGITLGLFWGPGFGFNWLGWLFALFGSCARIFESVKIKVAMSSSGFASWFYGFLE